MSTATLIHTIAIFPKVQPDTAIAVFLLYEFGESQFPGISKAGLKFWTALPEGKTAAGLEAEGVLAIDLGGGRFDHHVAAGQKKTESAATLIAKHLGVVDKSELKKLLMYAKRDDLEGKGTVSQDPLDRAFGLSGLITTMNRVHQDEPELVLGSVLPMIRAHYIEEYKRQVEMPREWQELKQQGKGQELVWETKSGKLRVMAYESDNISLAGFLRAYFKADLVIQRFQSGHTNIVTNQKNRLDLRPVIRELRKAEAARGKILLEGFHEAALEAPGRLEEILHWFYDTAANTLQNGGIAPQDTPRTMLSLDEIATVVKDALKN